MLGPVLRADTHLRTRPPYLSASSDSWSWAGRRPMFGEIRTSSGRIKGSSCCCPAGKGRSSFWIGSPINR